MKWTAPRPAPTTTMFSVLDMRACGCLRVRERSGRDEGEKRRRRGRRFELGRRRAQREGRRK